jgi:hypothetical protein
VQWLFVQNEKTDIEAYKRLWILSSLKPKIVQNEQRLEEILEKYEVEMVR